MDAIALDIRTMAIMAALTSVLQAVALTTLWRAAPQAPGPREWALGGIMLALGMLSISFRNLVPDWASVIVANVLIVAAHAAYLAGINSHQNQRPDTRVIAGSILATVGLFLWFTYYENNVSARIIVISAVLVLLSATAAIRLSRPVRDRKPSAAWLVVVMLGAHAAFHLVRGLYTFILDRRISDFMQASIVHGAAFADIVIFSFVAGLGFSIMTVARTNERLADELASRTTLLSIIAHDIRSPFTALIGMTTLVSTSLEKGDVQEARILTGKVSRAAMSTLNLLEDLLIWSRAEFTAATRNASQIALQDLVEKKVHLFEEQILQKRIDVRMTLNHPTVCQYADELEMLVRNLLSNAIKFCPPDGEISIVTSSTDAGAMIEISNTVAATQRATSSVVKRRGEAPSGETVGTAGEIGMGIGLDLCRRLCSKAGHNLTIRADAKDTFTASLSVRELAA
ncbi:MAG: HAMP domain-containing histidine kinase [Alphaproteobacteria bacterium]|nr:HAMP domain-containing histidine kinase [Alphaproteobacteria bacterium]MBO6861520.1 HAMP domain-containing histidine kinase [Alphaproteobacteria bacterium]